MFRSFIFFRALQINIQQKDFVVIHPCEIVKNNNSFSSSEQMGIAAVVHLYVFPAKPYELMGDLFQGSVSVLGDYASVDCPLDPDEVRDSERPTKLRLPQPDMDVKSGMTIRESVRDVFIGGGEYVRLPASFSAKVAFL